MKKFISGVCRKFKELFCLHSFVRIGFHQEEENDVRYSVRHYECQKCRKKVYVDGRRDKYAAKAIIP